MGDCESFADSRRPLTFSFPDGLPKVLRIGHRTRCADEIAELVDDGSFGVAIKRNLDEFGLENRSEVNGQ